MPKLFVLDQIITNPVTDPKVCMVVRADDAKHARTIAQGFEAVRPNLDHTDLYDWMSDYRSTCKELTEDGDAQVIVFQDEHADG